MTPTIRPEEPRDRDAIAEVVTAAFGSRLESTEARLVAAIRASENYRPGLALVAELDGEIVGHVMVSFVGLDDGDTVHRVPSLSPLAVAPRCQRAGIGSALVREVVRRADAAGDPFVVLEGDPRYYSRLGFEHSVPHGIDITLPSWAPPEAAQVLLLTHHDPALRGRVVYPPAFDEATEHP